MKTKLLEIIDFEKIDVLLEAYNRATGFVTAILDPEGNVLSKSGWRQICTEFHRIHPKTAQKCLISDTELANKMELGEKCHFYKCLNGMVDVAFPIVIKGEHIANLFTGQFFFEKPDVGFFKKQAKKYGFDEKTYLEALEKVPVLAEEQVKIAMDFLLNMTELIAEMSFQQVEQAQLNEALNESENYFRAIYNNSPDMYVSVSSDDASILNCNETLLNNLGYSRKEVIGAPIFKIYHDNCLDEVKNVFQQFVETGNVRDKELILKRKDGSSIDVSLNVNSVRDNSGKILYSISSCRDITERKHLEEEIIQKNKNLLALLEISQKLAKSLDIDYVLTEIVINATNLIGLDTGAIYLIKGENLYLSATTPPIPADFPEIFRHSLLKEHPHIQQSISTGQPVIVPDMDKADLSPSEQAIRESRMMRSLLYVPLKIENRALGVMILGTTEKIKVFSEDEINLYRSMSGQATMAVYSSQLFEEIKKLNVKLEQRIKDRTAELFESQSALLNIVEDLNEKTAELEKSSKLLEAKNKELETFTYSVSHDLKAPLRGIDGYSRLLEEEYADALKGDGQKFVKTIREGTKQMTQLIEDLLDFSRLERSVIRNTKLNIKELIDTILFFLKNDIKNNKISIDVNVNNFEIISDSDGLTIALRNVIENAVKFSGQVASPKIEIVLKENVSSWVISVEDNGIGFDMKFHDRIFEIFQRLNLLEKYEGTGIGLAMVHKTMERLGGKVWAQSAPGKGAKFYLEIPKK